jgi:hypothetical protein
MSRPSPYISHHAHEYANRVKTVQIAGCDLSQAAMLRINRKFQKRLPPPELVTLRIGKEPGAACAPGSCLRYFAAWTAKLSSVIKKVTS